MVDLALLCNLYADGPTTLGRLRELGCESLADVERLERADLEWALQAGAESCERFRREARALRERVGARTASRATPEAAPTLPTNADATRTREGAVATSAPHVQPAASGSRAASDSHASAPLPESHDPAAPGRAADPYAADEPAAPAARSAQSGSLLGVLLQAWRRASGRGGEAPARPRHESNERRVPAPRDVQPAPAEARSERPADAAATRPAPTERAPSGPATAPEAKAASESPSTPATGAPVPTVELTPAEPRTPARGAAAPLAERRPEHGTPLERIGFQGVEADYAEQLARLGVRTVEDFLATQPLDLAGRSTMRYTVLLRMQFLARRELERVVRG
jgi:hypothetical protein